MTRRLRSFAGCAVLVMAACGGRTGAPGSGAAVTPSPGGAHGGSPGATVITVVGDDYLYRGMPSSVPVGTVLRFQNASAREPHEMVVVRRREGTTESFAEILALPAAEAQEKLIQAAHAFAEPGETAGQEFAVDHPGAHALVCFIPVGTVPTHVHELDGEAGAVELAHAAESHRPDEGVPHHRLGMLQEFTVTE